MAEIKNNFVKSRMNKDLDSRLIPPGEYRDAQNVSVSKSESEDVGALENILGNISLTNFSITAVDNIDIIGKYMDVVNDRIFVFMTNYVDTSSSRLSNPASVNSIHKIGVYNISTQVSTIIVSGSFLNFSKTNSIYGVNLIKDLMFWTDNRNQPRKINVNTATANNSYYISEDSISVAKYYPHKAIDLYKKEVINWTNLQQTAPDSDYFIGNNLQTTGGSGTGLTIDITAVGGLGTITTFIINNTGSGYINGDTINLNPKAGDATIDLVVEIISTMQDVVSEKLPDGVTDNPLRQPFGSGDLNWSGDTEYLKKKFVRFSYRFKFDDGEYSLIAPFTQECFVPQQDGYFIGTDEDRTYKSTEVGFMQNKINNIILIINSPELISPLLSTWNSVADGLKITEIDIIYKESNQNVIKIIDTIKADVFGIESTNTLSYIYKSTKPWKILPSSEILRVFDQVPIRALAQEVSNNRVIYGNYIDKHTPPLTINYSLNAAVKLPETSLLPDGSEVATIKEYQNHTLKQNRTYQVGIVLADRYGRQSTVILSSIDKSTISSTIKGSTLFHPFKKVPFSSYDAGDLLSLTDTWPGDSLQMTFHDIIGSTKSTSTGEPGLYNEVTNPLGWYSFKIVVKQIEQDYYNVYFPGILNGYIDGESDSPGSASSDEPICHFVLYSDNINKIPRDLSLVDPNQKTFRTGRPSPEEDPSYYQFGDDGLGLGFSVDPFTESGEKLLKARDRKRNLDSGSQITNASIKLSPRVQNKYFAGASINEQSYPGTNVDVVTTIGTGTELGLWDPSANSPYNTAPVFFNYKNNPYIAKVSVSNFNIGVTGPSPDAGKFILFVNKAGVTSAKRGKNYVAGSKNVNTKAVTYKSITGLILDINAIDNANSPTGGGSWESEAGDGPGNLIDGGLSVANKDGKGIRGVTNGMIGTNKKFLVLSGDSLGETGIDITKETWPGKMSPILTIYETEPIESKLDIYWETSTNGLIDELNTSISASDTTTPVGFAMFGGGELIYLHTENLNSGAAIIDTFYAVNGSGTNLPTFGPPSTATAILTSVLDGGNNERKSDFTLVSPTLGAPDSFTLETNAIFMYGATANINEVYTFYIDVTVPSETWATDGTYITRSLTIGPYSLKNIAPSITNSPESYPLPGSVQGGMLIYTFTAVNGSFVTGGKETEELTFFINNDASGKFYLVPTAIEGEIGLYTTANTPALHSFNLIVTDGGGHISVEPVSVLLS